MSQTDAGRPADPMDARETTGLELDALEMDRRGMGARAGNDVPHDGAPNVSPPTPHDAARDAAAARGTGRAAIYVNCFMPSHTLDRPPFVPIQVGAALAKRDLGMVRDDSGDTISERNARYCEMTGTYWVWKNVELPDYVGFHHYRRFFDFSGESRKTDVNGFVMDLRVGRALIERYGLDAEHVERAVQGVDGLIPVPFDVGTHGHSSVRDQYLSAKHHVAGHLDILETIMAERGETDARALRDVMDGRLLHANNMFVFSRALFVRYCEWIFPILDALDARIDRTGLDAQERRAVGYIAERLLSVFLRVTELDGSDLRLRELVRVGVRDTTALPDPVERIETDLPLFTVVASTDQNYVPHMAALIASVFEEADEGHFVHFVVLDGGMGKRQRQLMLRLKRLREHAEITFVPMGEMFAPLAAHTYFTRATFYRLVLPDIMPDHDKVVFLDTDLVVVEDPTPLMHVDVTGRAMAAVDDLVMRSFVELEVLSLDKTGGVPAGEYLADYLDLGPDDTYRQVGVLVLNLDWLRETGLCETMIEDLAERPHWFLDQDVINMRLARHAVPLEARWNVIHMDERHRGALGEDDEDAYAEAHRDPAIVHYAGIGKPWRNDLSPFGHYYWEYLRLTPFYESVLFPFLDARYASDKVAKRRCGA